MDTTPTPVTTGKDRKGLAIAGFVVALASLLFSFIPCIGGYALFGAIIGTILSFMSRKSSNRGLAVAGIVCGIIGIIGALFQFHVASATADALNEAAESFETMDFDDL